MVNNNNNNSIKYFLPGPNSDVDKKASDEITQLLQINFKDVFNGIRCFDGTYPLQVKQDSKPYWVPQRCIAYILQQLFKEELEHLQQQDIITQLGIDETAEWCNSFVLVLK